MMRLVMVILMCVLTMGSCIAQQYSSKSKKAIGYFEEGRKAYARKEFGNAINLFKMALDKDPNFLDAMLVLGDISYDLKRFDKSAEYYQMQIDANPNFFSGTYMNLAKALYRNGDYEKAKGNIDKYLEFPARNEVAQRVARDMKVRIYRAAELKASPVPFDPKKLDGVNSKWEDYHPSITVDGQTMLFTRKDSVGVVRGRTMLKEDLYYAKRDEKTGDWSQAMNFGTPINTKYFNEGAQCIAPDGQSMFITICNKDDGMGGCDLYYAEKHGNRWSEPKNLGRPVNSNKWDAQPSLSSDGRTLFFTSARPGGKGKMDIYMSRRDSLGKWSAPISLDINTEGSELTPFIHSDGRTFFFASDGIPGLGGFDLYVVKIDEDGNFGKPENLGYPINTNKDNHGMIVGPSGRYAYFSSEGEGQGSDLDLYSFELPEKLRAERVGYAKGKVIDLSTKKGIQAEFELIDLETGERILSSRSDDKDGSFLVSLPSHRNYALNVSKPGYLFYSENISLKDATESEPLLHDVELQPIEKGSKVVLNNVFFETASFELKNESRVELNKLARFLKKNPGVRIEIGGHTDDVGSDVNNQRLSENRARAVRDYVTGHGVEASRLTFKGYGESKPIASNKTEEGRAKNRRTEFMVIE